MNLSDLGKEIARIGAPLLGHVIGGKTGEALGIMVAEKFGGNIDDPKDLLQRIKNDPESNIKLCQIQAEKQVDLERLAVLQSENSLKYSNENTADARKSNLESKSMMPQVLSLIVCLGFYICIYWIAAFNQDTSDRDVLYMLLGIMGTAFGAIINYWFGSSAEKGNK